jgi:hypothetical protein
MHDVVNAGIVSVADGINLADWLVGSVIPTAHDIPHAYVYVPLNQQTRQMIYSKLVKKQMTARLELDYLWCGESTTRATYRDMMDRLLSCTGPTVLPSSKSCWIFRFSRYRRQVLDARAWTKQRKANGPLVSCSHRLEQYCTLHYKTIFRLVTSTPQRTQLSCSLMPALSHEIACFHRLRLPP